MKAGSLVIGKRVSLAAAIGGISEACQLLFPEYAAVIGQLTVPCIFVVQVFVANRYGITT